MSMELFHRNMAFTLHHADQLPLVTMGKATVEKMEGDAYRVRVDVTNDRVIPTIMVKAANTNIVPPDVLTLEGQNASVITAGVVLDKFQSVGDDSSYVNFTPRSLHKTKLWGPVCAWMFTHTICHETK